MKSGAIVANSGHFNVEIDIPALREMSVAQARRGRFVEEYELERRPRSSCSPRDGSSTSQPRRATRRR